MLMLTGSQKVRLLTFREIPEFVNSVELPGLNDAVAQLSADSVLFENHYLQSVGLGAVFGTPPEFEWLRLLEQLVVESGRTVSVVFHGESSAFDEFRSHFPSCFDVQFVSADHSCVRNGISPEKLVALQESDLVWLHCDVSAADFETDLEFATVFNEQIAFGQQLDGEVENLLFITSLNGTSETDVPAFESLLFEGLVRVPLWAKGFQVPPRRIQVISGSYDLAFTISQCLSMGAIPERGVVGESIPPTVDSPLDLRQLCCLPVANASRALIIRTPGATAIRTEEFLFVRAASADGGMDGEVALYAKPRDVWNLNDVSAQYMELVQEFGLRLN